MLVGDSCRYTLKTLLALLEEVEQAEEVNFDWNALVKKTKTGITNAREYQMLWRHLAYRHAFDDGLVDGAQPLVCEFTYLLIYAYFKKYYF